MKDQNYYIARNILFNELGLTKEYIRAQVDAAVKETVRSHLNHARLESLILPAVRELVEEKCGGVPLGQTIRFNVQQEIAAQVAAKFEFTVSLKESS